MSMHSIFMVLSEMLIMVVICCGNLLTILAVWRTKTLQTIPNQYIVSLARADFLAGLILPYHAAMHLPGIRKFFDNDKYLCRHVAFFVSLGQTIQCITVIAIDRVLYIGFPMKYQRIASMFRARVIIIWTWISAVFLGTLPIYVNNWHLRRSCHYTSVIPYYYHTYIQTTIFVFFSIINAVCYGYIFYIAKKQQEAINQQLASVDDTRQATNMKAVKMFLTVFGIFFICLSPGIVAQNLGRTIGIPNRVVDVTILLAVLNSGMNFFIYAVKNTDFRRAFAKMLCCRQISVTPDTDHTHVNSRRRTTTKYV
ncbi:beta-2 adrenergic receptor-like [Patella vulgata]|uniref:beta-2 adrenergic receptor-like n=1 Tax=Patella vulgata TaxID=6465 RepID=UPI0024A8FFC7|nr:beta-2 adrenergic receptor-like [Patella vulgata]